MSGGHWGYQSDKLQEMGENLKGLFLLLATIEHELDWGICGDTCLQCAKRRVGQAMEIYFDGHVSAAIAVMNDRSQFQCLRCSGARW